MKIPALIPALAAALALLVSDASARTLQTWDKTITTQNRFKLVLDDQAVLDNETGLVWQRSPSGETKTWASAALACRGTLAGNRAGFRLPRADELLTLLTLGNVPALPSGHPFLGISVTEWYWTATTTEGNEDNAIEVVFGGFISPAPKWESRLFWCVRGPGATN
jgi:hypothetical protein